MPVNLSIKNAPDDLVRRLRERARRNHRSLQGELLAIVEAAVPPTEPKLSADEFLAEIRRLGLTRRNEAATLVREDRDAGHQR
jgi:plasmid stability protein